ncbi:MAG: hypothetical protein KJ732_00130 [Candidatus Margulisbacteria bacterium]|nr:hypothetical protein [Candidatus Margulisiibacteriota bacterium]
MSPKRKKKKPANTITLDPVELSDRPEPADHYIDSNHAETLQNHIKESVGGSLVSVSL